VSTDQVVLLGGVNGYRAEWLGLVRQRHSRFHFPITEKTRTSEQILRYASLVLGPTLSQRRGAFHSNSITMGFR